MRSKTQEIFEIVNTVQDLDSSLASLFDSRPIVPTNESLNWYQCLTADQKIYLKGEAFERVCGLSWDVLSYFFTIRERIELVYRKLVSRSMVFFEQNHGSLREENYRS